MPDLTNTDGEHTGAIVGFLNIMNKILDEEKPNQKEKIKLGYDECRKYIPDSVPYSQTSEYIFKALEFYQAHLERQRRDRDAR